ncbi:MAG: electron transport complex subunit RsxC [Lachnospiraceae bacterium]|jgi:electron transport complex, rnfABCDGE type, C subunit|nr:electron transport complex subunit RsxC [Lachnospiraceae bacterium]MBF1018313.1 electron transport complex subunit RsxC [Lachnospiraceae bacterium]
MAKPTFVGGVHPYGGKELTMDKPIKPVLPKGDLVYPLSQHIGAPAKPVVAVGDSVLTGQMIAEAGGFVSAPIYATVSGKVKAIEPRRLATGGMCQSIIVENDGKYEAVEMKPSKPYEEMSAQDKIEAVRNAGIVGMGGAGFPTAVKFAPKEPEKIEYVIANCAECEPYLTSDYRRMIEDPEQLIGGLKIAVSIFPNARGILAVEDNKPEAIAKLEELTRDEDKITVKALQTKYPQGGERMIIHACTGRDINSRMLPADVGCIVDNVDTLCAVYRAVMRGEPLMERIVTITGDAITDPCNYRVRIGTNYKELIDAAGGFVKEPAKIISGGPMMGFAVFDLDVPTTKTASAMTCLTEDVVAELAPSACINCSRCVDVCPEHLIPKNLADAVEHNEEEKFLHQYGMECIECGSCSYICPARRQLAQLIKGMRKIQMGKMKKK